MDEPAFSASQADDFSFSVSHDLRAPLRVVEGFTRILKEDYGPGLDKVANDHLDRVLAATERMNQMIDALLDLARLSDRPLQRQAVNLSELAVAVMEELQRQEPQREADIHIEPDIVSYGDPTLLRVALDNLLGNAWKYSSRSARTAIDFHRRLLDDGTRVICVRDEGAGFDMRHAGRLFGPFQRLHRPTEFPGHGIGLATVRRIVMRHGGRIWAEGEPQRGALFCFTIPERSVDTRATAGSAGQP